MHPRIAELTDHIARCREDLLAAVNEVPEGTRDMSPSPDQWSTAQILEHLGLVERRITGMLSAQIASAREEGVGTDTERAPVLPTVDLDRMMDRSARIAAAESGHPVRGLSWHEAIDEMASTRRELFAVIAGGDGLALGERSVPHRAFGPLSLYEWIALVGAHERRHAKQIREQAQSRD